MSELAEVENLYKELQQEWNKKPQAIKKCGQLLDKLKVALTKLAFLPTKDVKSSKSEMILSRNVLEIAVEYSVVTRDIPAFERYMSQLKCYYFDYKKQIGESENMYKLLGLNLLYLLSVNRVSEFHTELELLQAEIIHSNKYICPILALEQYIMEGRYNKIFQAKVVKHKGNFVSSEPIFKFDLDEICTKSCAPSDIYCYFMDILLCTVRDEIAACIEKAYEKISLQEAGKRLNLKSLDDVRAFGKKRNWQLGPDNVYSFVDKSVKPKEILPSVELAEQAIFYARELEMIV